MLLAKCTLAWKLVSSLREIIAAGRTDSTYPRWSDQFLSFCEQAADSTLKYLEERVAYSAAKNSVDREHLAVRLSAIIQGWELLHTFIKPVLDADSLKVPYPLVHFLTEHVGQLKAVSKAKFVVEISPELNYFQHQHSDLRRAILFLQAAIDAQPVDETMGFLALPCSQSRGLFMNCLLYHEVGHFVAEERGLLSPTDRVRLRGELESDFLQLRDGTDRSLQQYLDWAVSTIEKWIEELFADLVAVRLLGAAYTLSYMELLRLVAVLSDEQVAGFSIDYPADALRFREQLNVLAKDNWEERLSELSHWDQLQKISAIAESEYSVPSDYIDDPDMSGVWQILIKALCKPERIAAIHQNVAELLEDRDKPSELYAAYADGIEECLAHGIVPSNDQGGTVPHPVAVINGGALFLLSGIAALHKTVPSRKMDVLEDRAFLEDRIELWCLKAIEDWLITAPRRQRT